MLEVENWGPRIKRLRMARNLSQEMLAHEIGITTSTLSRWERGIGTPSRLAKESFKRYLESLQWGMRKIFYEGD
jgi:putative transcriptional regulator